MKGERAEAVAQWYLRLNGFMSISGYVIHLDDTEPRRTDNGEEVIQRTEADIVAVRFPFSSEIVAQRSMVDDDWVTQAQSSRAGSKVLFVLAEVKTSVCQMNGPWTNKTSRNMQRVIRRMGFAECVDEIDEVAESLYTSGRWEGRRAIVQYVCFGTRRSNEIEKTHPEVFQITWSDIGRFLESRHGSFPEKMPGGGIQQQWPSFGRKFADWFSKKKRGLPDYKDDNSGDAVLRYIHNSETIRRMFVSIG